MTTPNTAGHSLHTQPRQHRLLLRALAVVLILILVIVAAAVAIPWISRYQKTQRLQESVDAAYTPATAQADQREQDGQAILTALVGPVALEASSTRCVISSQDAGLYVRTWEVECVIRTVEVYRTDKTYPSLAAQLEQQSRAQGGDPLVLGNQTDTPAPLDGCGTLRGWSGDSLLDPSMRITRLAAGAFDPSELIDFTDHGCVVPTPVFDLHTTQTDSTFPAAAVSPEHSWVTVERETPFLRQDLGCAPTLLWCGLPVFSQILPRP